jgi:hypothetical protein
MFIICVFYNDKNKNTIKCFVDLQDGGVNFGIDKGW